MSDGSVPAIQFNNVSKSFDGQAVLSNISFDVQRGEALCILGRSGTGKSVTLKQINGLIKPDSGRVIIEEKEVSGLRGPALAKVRKNIGFLFQYAALFDSITVGENVAFPLRRHSTYSQSEIARRAGEKLEELGLEDVYDRMPAEMSGGMKKRAGLARALILEPSILLVDEPSSGLDPITAREIDELLLAQKQNRSATIVVVTHNIPSARRIGDTLALLHDGAIRARGTPGELDQNDDPLVREFFNPSEGEDQ
jgi:phospholipid/cholesterol/gamma-HCH transport system ATP-binding protein